jgi:hypothetical protein
MTTEFDPSFDRVWRGEKHKAEEFGPGGTKQAQAGLAVRNSPPISPRTAPKATIRRFCGPSRTSMTTRSH